ncbi:CDP-diacylglycerol--serine O-phosphatidyltransferase [Candidatus Purcelliella pentastirinorum]|uniref:CDP-diacylglycerol--serine O-phosphatidyltransferase n=1 Tax=Candidatus Purcelliella pentastirinorum TaxID=472834 RepID=A0AAX3N906_9ENTR|nr:CDP-diacylglycerol--serine O-phosphatidyltransferase [Candidatus Purcelliella pentastirinorum]WDI78420.1 CDP-diacylglycerol--serine O-phosphatidyltransferase [Candidatus Purcelliella pentastirinorum]WDR80551.1 CDP-diacylglycerol--serine O-phosphatidyltransferase [Candidatus Purcelliella pentastirinorum]
MSKKKKLYKNKKYLKSIPKIPLSKKDIKFLISPKKFRKTLINKIKNAKDRICIVTLYLENDESGYNILKELYSIKKKKPNIKINILVDWFRARRNLIGSNKKITNMDWYIKIAKKNKHFIPIHGIPIANRETMGVLHLKGIIIDDYLIYSGANMNNLYLQQKKKYRHDRYQIIKNKYLTNIMYTWINKNLINKKNTNCINKKVKNKTKKKIKNINYSYKNKAKNNELSIAPIVGIGKKNPVNQTIINIISSTKKKLIICTPYFNLPIFIKYKIKYLLKKNTKIEIIVSDKKANDFYINKNKKFNIIGILPYLYEINLRNFIKFMQNYINKKLLTIRIWKNKNNSYHVKGIWSDNKWIFLTGNNLNPRSWNLDLENALLIHDPKKKLKKKTNLELNNIINNTKIIKNYSELKTISEYPKNICKLIRRIRRIHIDKIINKII